MIDGDITDILYYITLLVYFVTIIGTVIIVLSENRNPLKSIAWILVLLFLPVVGLLFYILIGRDFRKMRLISRRSYKRINQHSQRISETWKGESQLVRNQINLIHRLNHCKLYTGNAITPYITGASFFDSFFEEVRLAKKFIHIQFYIFKNDEVGNQLIELLIEKARQGLEVRVMYDDVGSWSLKSDQIKRLEQHGIEMAAFFEVRFPAFTDKINYRNHRKIVVIDGQVGYIGGMNVADHYLKGLEWGDWRDTQIKIVGPAVRSLQISFSVDWYFCTHRLLWDHAYFPEVTPKGNVAVQIITSGPIGEWREIMMALFRAISSAHQYVYIQTPYFLPNEPLKLALQTAALSNVDVRLMIPARSDSVMVHLGSCSFLDSLLLAGVKIYLYKGGFIHAKMTVIDDEYCTIGSANMDFRSFEHNFEANAFLYDAKTAKEMRQIFFQDQKRCEKLTLKKWRNRPLRQKALESVVRLFSPLL